MFFKKSLCFSLCTLGAHGFLRVEGLRDHRSQPSVSGSGEYGPGELTGERETSHRLKGLSQTVGKSEAATGQRTMPAAEDEREKTVPRL